MYSLVVTLKSGIKISEPIISNYLFQNLLGWILEKTSEVQNKKTEEQDQKSISSVSVPPTGQFYEPFMKDLELIWQVSPI